MRCPRCVQPIGAEDANCPHCGFGLGELDEVFGGDAVILDRLTDAARCLRLRDREGIGEDLDRFEQRFPQLFAVVYLGFLPRMTNIRQFGFWLLNRAAVTSVDYTKPNDHGVLLVLDLNSQSAALTLGYRVEPFVRASDLTKVLKAGQSAFGSAQYGKGVRRCLRGLGRVLRKGARQAPANLDSIAARYSAAPETGSLGVRSIREEHEHSRTGTGATRAGQVHKKGEGDEG